MKILFLVKDLGVEKTTVFIEVVKALIERGAAIHIVIASQPDHYITERYYDEEPNVRVDVLDIADDSKTTIGSVKNFIRKHRMIEKISWTVLNFVMQWMFWIKNKINRRNEDYIFEEFLSPAMRDFMPQEQYDYIWTTDEYSLLWAEWINRHSAMKYKLVHHSFELYWEHFSLPAHKHWQYFKLYALFERARLVLQDVKIIIIQDEERWNILCQYTGIANKKEKYLLPVSIKDYPISTAGSIYEKMNIRRDKNIIFYPTNIMPSRGCMELVKMAQNLDDRFAMVMHGFMAIQDYLQAIRKTVLFPDKTIISNTTLDYQELLNMHQDVWCVFLYYGEEDYNHKYIVNASNKLVMALQAGKPIITLGNQMLAGLCAEYRCGIAINGWVDKGFADAVYTLEQNYDFYCKNARRCYEERFNIKPYADKIYDRLLAGI